MTRLDYPTLAATSGCNMADHFTATPLSYLLGFLWRAPQHSATILRVPLGIATSFFPLASNTKVDSFLLSKKNQELANFCLDANTKLTRQPGVLAPNFQHHYRKIVQQHNTSGIRCTQTVVLGIFSQRQVSSFPHMDLSGHDLITESQRPFMLEAKFK